MFPPCPAWPAPIEAAAQQFVNDLTGTIGNINQTYNANSPDAFLPMNPPPLLQEP
jgi:hypothetical protein